MPQRDEDSHILGIFSSTVWWSVFGLQCRVLSATWARTNQTKTNTHPWQTQLLPQFVEHHEELYRKRAFKDTHACEQPVPTRAHVFLLNEISNEFTKLPFIFIWQVNFNEPLSMLQRLSEDLEYYELLDKAAKCHNSLEQMCYVAAFTVSSYSTTVHRTGKPFNPLLGETFELDRLRECGYRSLCEQVRWNQPVCSADSLKCRTLVVSDLYQTVEYTKP